MRWETRLQIGLEEWGERKGREGIHCGHFYRQTITVSEILRIELGTEYESYISINGTVVVIKLPSIFPFPLKAE